MLLIRANPIEMSQSRWFLYTAFTFVDEFQNVPHHPATRTTYIRSVTFPLMNWLFCIKFIQYLSTTSRFCSP